jgi:hypothetical protein
MTNQSRPKAKIISILTIIRYFHLSTFFPILAFVLLPAVIWPTWFHHLFNVFIIPPSIGHASWAAFLESPMVWYYGSFTLVTVALIILNREVPTLLEYTWLASATGCVCAILNCPPVAVSFFFLLAAIFPFCLPKTGGKLGWWDKITCFMMIAGMLCLLFFPFLHVGVVVSAIAAGIVILVAPGLLINYLCQPGHLDSSIKLKISLTMMGLTAYFVFFSILAKAVLLRI